MEQHDGESFEEEEEQCTIPPDVACLILENTRANGGIFNEPGDYLPSIDWSTGFGTPDNLVTVDPEVYNQGNNGTCWVWPASEACRAAHRRAGHEVPRLSPQDLLDHVPEKASGGGYDNVALEFVRQHGLCEHENYGEYTGSCRPETPRVPPMHRTDSWGYVADDERSMNKALKDNTLIITVPYYDSFTNLGDGVMDFETAERIHSARNTEDPTCHSVLLIGGGDFVPRRPRYKGVKIKSWRIKNQWDEIWGDGGFGLMMKYSALQALHAYTLDVGVLYDPLYALVRGGENRCLVEADSTLMINNFNLTDLLHLVEDFNTTLLFLFYSPGHPEVGDLNVREVMEAFAKPMAVDSSIKLALIDLSMHNAQKFGLDSTRGWTLLLYLPLLGFRNVKHGIVYPGQLTFKDLLDWFGWKIGACRR